MFTYSFGAGETTELVNVGLRSTNVYRANCTLRSNVELKYFCNMSSSWPRVLFDTFVETSNKLDTIRAAWLQKQQQQQQRGTADAHWLE